MPQYTTEMLKPLTDAVYPTNTVAYTGTAGTTASYPPGPNCVWVLATTAAFVLVGEAVTATATTGIPLAANVPVCLHVPRGTGAPWCVSAIQVASGGSIYVKPLGN